MEEEWITPQRAVERLLAHHYPGGRTGNLTRTRMALVGALRAGVVDWQCETWSEKFISDNGVTFDENGGPTVDIPKFGYPADFWRPELVTDDVFWTNNAFISYGRVTLNDAPSKVRIWLGNNNEAIAEWVRSADQLEVNWKDVRQHLWRAGWQTWIAPAHEPKRPPKRSWHYQDALIRMIGLAVREPDAIRDRRRLFDELVNAFEIYGDPPDTRELQRLASEINNALYPWSDGEAPIE